MGDPRRGGFRRLQGVDGGITVRFGTQALVKRHDHLHSRSRTPGVAAVAGSVKKGGNQPGGAGHAGQLQNFFDANLHDKARDSRQPGTRRAVWLYPIHDPQRVFSTT